MNNKNHFLSLILISLLLALVVGCGQKGELYLPDQENNKKKSIKIKQSNNSVSEKEAFTKVGSRQPER